MRLHVGSVLPLISTVVNLRVAQCHRSQQRCNGEGEFSQSFHILIFLFKAVLSVTAAHTTSFVCPLRNCLSPTTSQSCDSFLQLFSAQRF